MVLSIHVYRLNFEFIQCTLYIVQHRQIWDIILYTGWWDSNCSFKKNLINMILQVLFALSWKKRWKLNEYRRISAFKLLFTSLSNHPFFDWLSFYFQYVYVHQRNVWKKWMFWPTKNILLTKLSIFKKKTKDYF